MRWRFIGELVNLGRFGPSSCILHMLAENLAAAELCHVIDKARKKGGFVSARQDTVRCAKVLQLLARRLNVVSTREITELPLRQKYNYI
jgi:hypothetical protein